MENRESGLVSGRLNAEQCLDFLETTGDLLHAWKAATEKEVTLPAVAFKRLGASIVECALILREELNEKGVINER